MKYVPVPATAKQVFLGRRGENLARTLVLDISDWVTLYGSGAVELVHQRSMDESPYPCAVEQDAGLVRWAVTAADTAYAGTGKAELRYYVGDTRAKSAAIVTSVAAAMTGDLTEAPEAVDAWLEQLTALSAETKTNAVAAAESAGDAQTAEAGAKAAATGAATSELASKASEEAAAVSALAAKASETAAQSAADRAHSAAWVSAEINEAGHLIVSQSDNFTGATFTLNDNGHLEVAYT